MKLLSILSLVVLLFMACSPSGEEKAANAKSHAPTSQPGETQQHLHRTFGG